jgi:hypothetical protein
MKHSHYFKPVLGLSHVDVYRVLKLFDVTDPCLQHAIKKLLVAGGRGAGKDISVDVQEAVDSLARWQSMRAEERSATTTTQLQGCECFSLSVDPNVAGSCVGPLPGQFCRRGFSAAVELRKDA